MRKGIVAKSRFEWPVNAENGVGRLEGVLSQADDDVEVGSDVIAAGRVWAKLPKT